MAILYKQFYYTLSLLLLAYVELNGCLIVSSSCSVKLTYDSWMLLFETIGIFIADEDEAKSGGGGNIEQAERERVAITNTNAEADNRKAKKEEGVAERERPSARIEADIEKAKQERMKLVKIEEDRLAKEQKRTNS